MHSADVNREHITRILGMVAEKELIRSVALYRSIYGVGLVEAKEAVEAARATYREERRWS